MAISFVLTGTIVNRATPLLYALLLATACARAADAPAPVSAPPAPSTAQVQVDDRSFPCIRQMKPVRHFYVDNLLGNVDATLAAAHAPEGAIYPAGSVVQLVPTEAMVKREKGFSPATGDWEFFELEVGEGGARVGKRGFAEVNNRFGKNCFACHVPARVPWDFICESGHGCESIPIDHAMTGALQRSDPRCGAPAFQDGDRMALWKLKALVAAGVVVDWTRSLFQ